MPNHLQVGLGKQPRENGSCETTTRAVFSLPFVVQEVRMMDDKIKSAVHEVLLAEKSKGKHMFSAQELYNVLCDSALGEEFIEIGFPAFKLFLREATKELGIRFLPIDCGFVDGVGLHDLTDAYQVSDD